MDLANFNLWRNTVGYGSAGAATRRYLTEEQNCRLERMRVARMLWKGQHRKAFLEEGRSQFNFPPMKVQGRTLVPYVTFNLLRLISLTLADLMVGAEPILRVEGKEQQTLNDLANRSDLHRVFYDAAKEASWASEAVVEACRFGGKVYLCNLPPDEVYPLGARNPDGQYTSYRRFATATATDGKTKLLLETTFEPGFITRDCFKLDGTTRAGDVELSQWPVKKPDGGDLPEREPTGVDLPTIAWMGNELDEGQPTSDYDGLIELQDELNHKQTQIARVIAKHADPKMAIPSRMADAGGSMLSSHEVFWFSNKDEIPTYVVWNAELANAIADRDFTVSAMVIASELSHGILGIEKGAAPDSAKKLRLQATKALARKDRKAVFFRPFVRGAVDLALAMEVGARRVAVAVPASSLELRDGLPVDDLDEANVISTLTGGKQSMSLEAAVERRLRDPEAVAQEVERIRAEQAAGTPMTLLGPIGGAAGRETGEEEEGVAA